MTKENLQDATPTNEASGMEIKMSQLIRDHIGVVTIAYTKDGRKLSGEVVDVVEADDSTTIVAFTLCRNNQRTWVMLSCIATITDELHPDEEYQYA